METRKRQKFRAEELRALQKRSKNKCECCGLDITIDKHHIWEFAKRGPNIASNILCLCPSCHRTLPELLSEEDQKFVQTLNFEKRSDSFSFYSTGCEFEVGTVSYNNVEYILLINEKPVIYPYRINERFYANIVMLDGFDPYLLVIANRVIYKSDNVTLINKSDNLKIFNGHDFSFEIGKSDNRIKVGLSFKYRGYPFIFNDKCSIFPGNGHLKNVQLSNAKAAISWNMWQS